MEQYIKFKQQYSDAYEQLNKKFTTLSLVRLSLAIILIFFIYKSFRTFDYTFIIPCIFMFIGFIYLIKIHKITAWDRKVNKNLIAINDDEIIYLKREGIPFENGKEFIDPKHYYSYDLDFFGKNSIYQNINRTATYIGYKKLSELLLTLLKKDEIISNQEAVKELTEKIEWRHYLMALSKMAKDSKDNYSKLCKWATTKTERPSKLLIFLSYILPIILGILILLFIIIGNEMFTILATSIFLINLVVIATQNKKVKKEIIDADNISDIIKKYALIISEIENKEFSSKKLNSLKGKLIIESNTASSQLSHLSDLFLKLQSINNGMAAIILNGTFLYHIHALKAMAEWKKENAGYIKEWLDVIGEFEALNSLANFSYNNPNFIYPSLNETFEVECTDLGHPLILEEKRINNDIGFNEKNFIILTGSNMSGKSTFLRTLGINMILAGIGSPICATKAHIHPLPVIVSMRQADSLTENESYFFAEVKRLKKIIDKLQTETCFVLLDEILKGTNSDDKKAGTIEVIKKVISHKAIGAIATHDLEVCQTTHQYPEKLINKCFEVEIIDNELSFDYKLRNGICQNKSATFLMKKLDVI